ncbi:hypothetical protein GCM10023205_61520 [Yinghuangia aomiensis]|uniref:Helix-turn-helix domain-containing protein n=1 Tax=Yinghuangia aomiensis TaxID=676205 RepID=A0ABP9HZJ6_9ACTN
MSRPRTMKLPELLTELGISRASYYRMRAKGTAPKFKKLPNGQLRIRQVDLDAWWAALAD